MFISKKLFLLFQNVTKIVFSKFHEFLKNEKLCVFIVMVHKICQKFYKSALFPKNNALLFSKIVRFLGKRTSGEAYKFCGNKINSEAHEDAGCSILNRGEI